MWHSSESDHNSLQKGRKHLRYLWYDTHTSWTGFPYRNLVGEFNYISVHKPILKLVPAAPPNHCLSKKYAALCWTSAIPYHYAHCSATCYSGLIIFLAIWIYCLFGYVHNMKSLWCGLDLVDHGFCSAWPVVKFWLSRQSTYLILTYSKIPL